jgi:dimethylargininase
MAATNIPKPSFTQAIVRTPCKNMVEGLTSANLGKPDYDKALEQHKAYIQALKDCGLEVTVLSPDERFPDSTFVEDVALLTPGCAIFTNPGAPSRKGETALIREAVSRFYENTETIGAPGTIEAGDIMMIGSHFYIGISERTNPEGARQMIDILRRHGMDGMPIKMKEMLHLKTGMSYIENNHLLITGEFLRMSAFQSFDRLVVDEAEAYAANSVWINNKVLMPMGHPNTKKLVEAAGYQVIEVDTSEFQKLDGGLSCLSLRF